jgi:plastocyanin
MKILDESRGSTVTIVGVQPTVMESNNGNEMQGSSGEVVITSNRQSIAGQPYTQPDDFSGIAGKPAEAHQQVWNVLIDMDSKKVVDIQTDQQRVIYGTIQENSVITGMNMFMPDQAKVPPGTQVTWNNNSKLEHNVVGVFKTDSGKNIAIDSGFIPPGRSWSYTFQDAGLFDYQCTIHSQEGMKGAIIVTSA